MVSGKQPSDRIYRKIEIILFPSLFFIREGLGGQTDKKANYIWGEPKKFNLKNVTCVREIYNYRSVYSLNTYNFNNSQNQINLVNF